MTKFGGVPTEAQIDGYLIQIAASSTQKSGIVPARNNFHARVMPISKVEDFLAGNA